MPPAASCPCLSVVLWLSFPPVFLRLLSELSKVARPNATSARQRPPSIVPGSHDAELIHGAYLRNASCEGLWEASKDDLNVALPPPRLKQSNGDMKVETNTTSGGAFGYSGGDEEWLSELASSIGLSPDAVSAAAASSAAGEALSPASSTTRERAAKGKEKLTSSAPRKRTTRSAAARNKDSKPKDEKEVMNFFDNLLKK